MYVIQTITENTAFGNCPSRLRHAPNLILNDTKIYQQRYQITTTPHRAVFSGKNNFYFQQMFKIYVSHFKRRNFFYSILNIKKKKRVFK